MLRNWDHMGCRRSSPGQLLQGSRSAHWTVAPTCLLHITRYTLVLTRVGWAGLKRWCGGQSAPSVGLLLQAQMLGHEPSGTRCAPSETPGKDKGASRLWAAQEHAGEGQRWLVAGAQHSLNSMSSLP